jgi:hypothetical protein
VKAKPVTSRHKRVAEPPPAVSVAGLWWAGSGFQAA